MSRSRASEHPLLIGELSRLTGASPRSLRHYEANGLLSSTRGANGYRAYDRDSVATVLRIKRFLRLGLTLDAIGPILPCVVGGMPDACPELVATLEAEVARLEAVVAEATDVRASIEAVLDRLRAA